MVTQEVTPPVQKVLDAIPEDAKDTEVERPDRYTSTNGVRFKILKVPPMLVMDAQRRFHEPPVPKVFIEDKGVEEENPADPAYLEARREYMQGLAEVANSVFLTRGTCVIETPEGMPRVDDDTWIDDVIDLTGLEVPRKGFRRYYCWLKYIALVEMQDYAALITKVNSLAGVTTEREVTRAEDSFRDNEAGSAAEGVPAASADGRGPGADLDVTGLRA